MMIVKSLFWLLVFLISSNLQTNAFLQAMTNIQPVRRELDLNTTPTTSMEEDIASRAAIKQGEKEEVQSKTKKKRIKLSEKERKIRKYTSNKNALQRYRFKYSTKGQELAAKNLNPIEKAEYDKKLESLRTKNKEYKQRYYDKIKVGVEHNDPRAIRQDLMQKLSNRNSSRKYMRKIRAQKKEDGSLDNQNKHEKVHSDTSQPFVRRMEPEETQPLLLTRSQEQNVKDNKVVQVQRKFREKFTKSGQEAANLLDSKAKAEYDEQHAKYRARKKRQSKRYFENMKSLALSDEPQSIRRYTNFLENNRKRNQRYKIKKKLERLKCKEAILENDTVAKRPRIEGAKLINDNQKAPNLFLRFDNSDLPDLNESPPLEQFSSSPSKGSG